MISLTQKIDWKPFSEKHQEYIKKALVCKMSVAEGAIRSGKTIDNCIIAAALLEQSHDKIHLASGSTIANAKLNIGDCNGYGLEHLFRGRCRWGKYKDNDALIINTKAGEKVVIFVGGGKADSYKKILGNSYGIWIATEINEHYDAEDSRTSFIKVAFGRQVAAYDPAVLWDLNPCQPSHKIYTDYIDAYVGKYRGGYNYEHFTIADNLSISEERRLEIESQYDVGSIWYRRDILGERCIAEGLIYPNYEMAISDEYDNEAIDYCISMDYGTQNAFAALLWAKYDTIWVAIREYYYSGRQENVQKTDEEYASDIDAWISDIMPDRGIKTYIDPSAASFIALLRKRQHRYRVIQADNDVLNGIRETATAMFLGRLKIHPRCKMLIKELQGYVWENTDNDTERPLKVNDHACDAMRYFVKTTRIAVPKNRSTSIFI